MLMTMKAMMMMMMKMKKKKRMNERKSETSFGSLSLTSVHWKFGTWPDSRLYRDSRKWSLRSHRTPQHHEEDVPPLVPLSSSVVHRSHEDLSPTGHQTPSPERPLALALPVVWLQLHHSRWANGSQRQEIIIKSVISDFRHPDQQQHISSRSPSHHATPSAPWISIPSSPLHHASALRWPEEDATQGRVQKRLSWRWSSDDSRLPKVGRRWLWQEAGRTSPDWEIRQERNGRQSDNSWKVEKNDPQEAKV